MRRRRLFRDARGATFLCSCQKPDMRAIRRRASHLPPFTRQPLLSESKEYVERYEEIRKSGFNWIAFFGAAGCGKTTQTYLIVDVLLDRKRPVYAKFYDYTEFVRELSACRFSAFEYEKKFVSLFDAELLVLDDFLDVIPRAETFEEQILIRIIKRRYVQRKSLILTSELTPHNFTRLVPRHAATLIGRIKDMCDGSLVTMKDIPQANMQS